MSDTDFLPRWASPPGDTIRDALEERSLDQDALSTALGLPSEEVRALLEGSIPLTIGLADRLTALIGGSVEFWMTRDGQYHADLARVAADKWAQHMPVREMAEFGWISNEIDNWVTQIDECLRFFGVKDVPMWQESQDDLLRRTRFRSSRTVDTDNLAVAAWLRQCDVELSGIACKHWDREAFAALLPDMLPLTRIRDPREFLPLLADRCADVGVAVGVVRAPRGCSISGAARRLSSGQPSIALTARHRADDHLWFTFFHEAAHLVLHDTDALYLDEIELESGPPTTADEAEADEYAGEILVSPRYEAAITAARRAPFELRRLASEIGVSTGIVIGNLQHRGVLSYATRLNRLKRRYKWNGPTLEKA